MTDEKNIGETIITELRIAAFNTFPRAMGEPEVEAWVETCAAMYAKALVDIMSRKGKLGNLQKMHNEEIAPSIIVPGKLNGG